MSRQFFLSMLLGAGALIATCAYSNTKHEVKMQSLNTEHPSSSIQTFLTDFLPANFEKVHQQSVLIDGEQAQLVRYQTQSALTLDQANFSYLTNSTGHLKGFSYLDSSLIKDELPTKAQAQRIADDFLNHYAPDLLSNQEIHWIDRHDETIEVDGKKQQISGIKVKMRNLNDGHWFWVIIGSNRQPIIFERDIVWVNFPGHRKTEKWLHDSWLKDHIKTEVNTNEI